MGCVTVCGVVEGGALADAVVVALAAFAVAMVIALTVAAGSVVVSALPVVVPVFLAVCVALSWPTLRLMKHGSVSEVLRRHPVRPPRMQAPRQTALPAGVSLRAIEAPKRAIQGVIISETTVKEEAR